MSYKTILILLFALLASPLQAQEALEQEMDPTSNPGITSNINGTLRFAQTMTAGADGVLSTVELYLQGASGMGNIILSILPTVAGEPYFTLNGGLPPTTNVLANKSVDVATAPSSAGWFAFDVLSEGLNVNAGTTYAIVLSATGTAGIQWVGALNAPTYTGGESFFTTNLTTWTTTPLPPGFTSDLGFRTYLKNEVSVTDSTPYVVDFEDGAFGWIVDNGVWEIGQSTQSNISSANSGQHCLATVLDSTYPHDTTSNILLPTFDFSGLTMDPVVSMAIFENFYIHDDGMRLEIDRNDGNGFVPLGTGTDWYSRTPSNASINTGGGFWGDYLNPWHRVAHRIEDVVGRPSVNFRFVFFSDPAILGFTGANGGAIDDFRIEVPIIKVTSTDSYFEDFEDGDDGWYPEADVDLVEGTSDLWELGTPQQSQLSTAYSGGKCWMTDLDGDYFRFMDASVYCPPVDLSALSVDPVFSIALNYQTPSVGFDGYRLEMDLGNGNGYQTVGSANDWYDGPLTFLSINGEGWRYSSNGWIVVRHALTGAAGNPNVRLRIRFGADDAIQGEGVCFDDVRIYVPTFPGTATTLSDDVRMEVRIDGEREIGSQDAYDVQVGETVQILSESPRGDLVTGDYYLICEAFLTGNSFGQVAPDAFFSLTGSTFVVDGGAMAPFFLQAQMAAGGMVHDFPYFGGAAGLSLMTQCVVVKPSSAANGFYATSDAFELKFQ